MDIAYLLRRAVREHPGNVAVVDDRGPLTYAALDARAQRLANALRGAGLQPGDAVAVLLGNRAEYVEVDAALAYGGFVRVALNARLNLENFLYVIADSGARALIAEAEFDATAEALVEQHDLLWLRVADGAGSSPAMGYEAAIAEAPERREVVPVDARDRAWLPYTSGTTGTPKGVVLSVEALVRVAANIMVELGPVVPGSSILLPQPLSHGAGFFVLPYLAAGGTVHVMGKFDAEHAVAWGKRERIDTLKIVPVMLMDLLEVDRDVAFDSIIYGAAPIALSILESALERFGSRFTQIYGQSEAPVTITVLHRRDHEQPGPQRAAAGRPWRTVQVEVLREDGEPTDPGELGEVTVRSDHLMDGYHGRDDLTREVLRDGRLWTRDLAVVDEAGYIYLRGRRDELINSGGFNIAPKEVEEIVNRHPDVQDCVAVGVPHERWGEAVRVYVTARAGHAVEPDELDAFCEPLLGFRRPRSIVVVDEFPRNAYGKVDRQRLVDARVAPSVAEGAGP